MTATPARALRGGAGAVAVAAGEEASSAGGAVSAAQVNKVTNKHDGKSLT